MGRAWRSVNSEQQRALSAAAPCGFKGFLCFFSFHFHFSSFLKVEFPVGALTIKKTSCHYSNLINVKKEARLFKFDTF